MKTNLILLSIAAACMVTLPVHAARGNAEAGKAKSAVCAACHGEDGVSKIPFFPKLAGQHPDYLVHALQAYKAGKRKNPIMAEQAKNLSEADMEDLAAYFSAQKGLSVKY